eukprot:2236272-Prymnesium_polylepis.2
MLDADGASTAHRGPMRGTQFVSGLFESVQPYGLGCKQTPRTKAPVQTQRHGTTPSSLTAAR